MKIFGTDGVRGKVGIFPLIPSFLVTLAQTVSTILPPRSKIAIGHDTRISASMVESALIAGFTSRGMNISRLGTLPTPAVALATCTLNAQLGVMISASHNPFTDNGIKFFNSQGEKLSLQEEQRIETALAEQHPLENLQEPSIGSVSEFPESLQNYKDFIKRYTPNFSLKDLKLVVDCANGAYAHIAPPLLAELGANVIAFSTSPNGKNINEACGSLHPQHIQEAVQHHKAHLGLAFDGDGDRLILVDSNGNIWDGDQMIAFLGLKMAKKGELKGDAIVGTVMTNKGLEQFLQSKNIKLIRTDVGDRAMFHAMRQNGCNLGGEPSGHILLTDLHTTSDALLTGLLMLEVGQKALRFPIFEPWPRVLYNISGLKKDILHKESVQAFLEKATLNLGQESRIIIRPSGTEPVLRLMIEGQDIQVIEALAQDVCFFLKNETKG